MLLVLLRSTKVKPPRLRVEPKNTNAPQTVVTTSHSFFVQTVDLVFIGNQRGNQILLVLHWAPLPIQHSHLLLSQYSRSINIHGSLQAYELGAKEESSYV